MNSTLRRASSSLNQHKKISSTKKIQISKTQQHPSIHQKEVSPQILLEREKKYKQIMKLISSYKRSSQDIENLEKIKKQTTMQINLRFMNSNHNQNYQFPFVQDIDQDDKQIDFEENKQGNLYDLHAQSYVVFKSMSMKILTLNDSKKRVKSLQRVPNYQNMIRRQNRRPIGNNSPTKIKRLPQFHQLMKNSHIKQEIIHKKRKNSLTDRKHNLIEMKLPQLKIQDKTPSKKKVNLGQVIGRKIMTQASPQIGQNRRQGNSLAKYLKSLEGSAKDRKMQEPKKFFLKQY